MLIDCNWHQSIIGKFIFTDTEEVTESQYVREQII